MNIPLEVAQAQGHHGIKGAVHGAKGAAHGIKGGRPRLALTDEQRAQRRRDQQTAYRRKKGIMPRERRLNEWENWYFSVWGKMPGEPLTPEEYAEREPLWNAQVQERQEAKTRRGEDSLEERLEHIKQYQRQYQPLKPYRAPASVSRNEPCPCGSGRKFKKCCG